jgi:hypothetical protein
MTAAIVRHERQGRLGADGPLHGGCRPRIDTLPDLRRGFGDAIGMSRRENGV